MLITKFHTWQFTFIVAICGCVELDRAVEESSDEPEQFDHVVSVIEDHANGERQSVIDGQVARAPIATASAPCSPIGIQNTAVILAVSPGESPQVSAAQLDAWFFGSDPSVDGYLRDASYGQASAAGIVLGPYTLDREYTCNEFSSTLRAKVLEVAGPDIYLPDFQRIVIVYDFGAFPTQCSWNGAATVGCYSWSDPSDGAYTAGFAWLNESSLAAGGPNHGPNDGLSLAIHEVGHLLGIGHAQSRDSGPEPIGAPGVATLLDEYGDPHSVMGQERNAGYGRFTHLAAPHKDRLGWLAPQVVTADGTYVVSPYENLAGTRALKILRPMPTVEWLWLELRQPIGAYDTTSLASVFGNALVHIEDASTGLRTQLIDFTPQSGFADATLDVGTSWMDPYSGLSLFVSPSGSDLQIGVAYGPATCTVAPAGVTLAPTSVSTTAGGTASFTLTVANHDTGTCPAAQAFDATTTSPTGWGSTTGVLASPFAVPNGGSTTMTVAQPVPATATVGNYTVSARSARGGTTTTATATVTVLPTVIATVPGTQFVRNQTVTFTAQVKNGGVGVAGVPVTFRLVNPNGTITTSTTTTNATGTAAWTYKLKTAGAYSLTATSTVQGKTGTSAPQGFTVVP